MARLLLVRGGLYGEALMPPAGVEAAFLCTPGDFTPSPWGLLPGVRLARALGDFPGVRN